MLVTPHQFSVFDLAGLCQCARVSVCVHSLKLAESFVSFLFHPKGNRIIFTF